MDDVYKAAKAAYKGWAKTPLWKRAEYLHKVAALLKENAKVGRTRQNDERALSILHEPPTGLCHKVTDLRGCQSMSAVSMSTHGQAPWRLWRSLTKLRLSVSAC